MVLQLPLSLMNTPTIVTPHFTLAPYTLKDEQRFVEMVTDSESVKFMGNSTSDVEKERAFFNGRVIPFYSKTKTNRIFYVWGIYVKGLLCGHFELKETTHTNNTELEIVYLIHPDARGKGLMGKVLDYFKTNQNKWGRTIIATANPKNKKSMHLLKKWGITKQKTIVDTEKENYEYLKVWLM